jgi:hypothetical protein
MSTTLLLSSLVSGLVAITVTLLFTYLPSFWRGSYYDILTSLGGTFHTKTKRVSQGSRLTVILLLFTLGMFAALFYAWLTLMFLEGIFPTPSANLEPGRFGSFSFFYPLVGAVLGLGQGVLVSLLTTFFVTARNVLEPYRESTPLVMSFLSGNTVYGALVMTCHALLLPLLLGS